MSSLQLLLQRAHLDTFLFLLWLQCSQVNWSLHVSVLHIAHYTQVYMYVYVSSFSSLQPTSVPPRPHSHGMYCSQKVPSSLDSHAVQCSTLRSHFLIDRFQNIIANKPLRAMHYALLRLDYSNGRACQCNTVPLCRRRRQPWSGRNNNNTGLWYWLCMSTEPILWWHRFLCAI